MWQELILLEHDIHKEWMSCASPNYDKPPEEEVELRIHVKDMDMKSDHDDEMDEETK